MADEKLSRFVLEKRESGETINLDEMLIFWDTERRSFFTITPAEVFRIVENNFEQLEKEGKTFLIKSK